jgi:hypothetical protein
MLRHASPGPVQSSPPCPKANRAVPNTIDAGIEITVPISSPSPRLYHGCSFHLVQCFPTSLHFFASCDITQIKSTSLTPINLLEYRNVLTHCHRLCWPLQGSHPTANTASGRAVEKSRSQPTEQSHSRMLELPSSKDQMQWRQANVRKL